MASLGPDANDVIIDEEIAEQLRELFEGMWVGIPVETSSEADERSDDFEDDFEDDDEGDEEDDEMEIFIVQSEELPHRFVAQYRRGDAEGEIDLRILPSALDDDFDGITVMFTFVEASEFDDGTGGGFAMGPHDGVLVGMMMYHMGPDVPLCWQRISSELPDGIRDMVLEGEWFDDDDDDVDEDGPVLLDELKDLLGGFLSFTDEDFDEDEDEDEDEDDEEQGANPTREALLEKSVEEFLLFQTKLASQLEQGGISTVAALLSATDEELLAVKGIGPGRLDEIKRVIQAWGLTPTIAETYEVDEALLHTAFRFRVSLDWQRDVWREIELLGEHTMHDFHGAIQEAFEWDDEHLYAFYMSGRYWDGGSAIEHPFSDGDISAQEIQLAGLGLAAGQRFVYLFDFGDELRHLIEVISISERAVSQKRRASLPTVVKSKGEAPEQHVWDDEFDSDDDIEAWDE